MEFSIDNSNTYAVNMVIKFDSERLSDDITDIDCYEYSLVNKRFSTAPKSIHIQHLTTKYEGNVARVDMGKLCGLYKFVLKKNNEQVHEFVDYGGEDIIIQRSCKRIMITAPIETEGCAFTISSEVPIPADMIQYSHSDVKCRYNIPENLTGNRPSTFFVSNVRSDSDIKFSINSETCDEDKKICKHIKFVNNIQ